MGLSFVLALLAAPLLTQETLLGTDVSRNMRYAPGPWLRAKEEKGWMFAAGELAMAEQDCAPWGLSISACSSRSRITDC